MSLKSGKSTSAFTIDSLISKSHCHQQKRKSVWNHPSSQSNHSNSGTIASPYSEGIEISAIPETSNSSNFPSSLSNHGSQTLHGSAPFLPNTFSPYGGVFPTEIGPASHLVPMSTAPSFHVPVSPISMTSATNDHLLVPSTFGNPICAWLPNNSGFPRPYGLTGRLPVRMSPLGRVVVVVVVVWRW